MRRPTCRGRQTPRLLTARSSGLPRQCCSRSGSKIASNNIESHMTLAWLPRGRLDTAAESGRALCDDRPVLDPNRPGPSLSELTVMETMHPGVVSCPSTTPLRVVARMLATHRIHAVIVFPEHRAAEPSEWSVVSDIDIVHSASLGDVESATAGSAAATPVVIVSPGDTLDHAARLMVERKTTHLIVVDPRSVRPMGVLSTLDVARALGELT